MLLSDFRARGSISMPTPPIASLTEFFHVDTEINVYLLPVSWYFISSLWRYPCSCMHIMSMLWSIAKAASSGSWSILFKVLTFNVIICIVILHLSNFCFCLISVADFSNTGARTSTSAGHVLFLTRVKGDTVWTCGLSVSYGNLSIFLIHRLHPKNMSGSSSLIKLLDPCRWPVGFVHSVRRTFDPSLGSSATLIPVDSEV